LRKYSEIPDGGWYGDCIRKSIEEMTNALAQKGYSNVITGFGNKIICENVKLAVKLTPWL
jgi:hypothetical protein